MKHLHTQACVIQSQCYSFSDMLAAEGAIFQQCVDVSSISDLQNIPFSSKTQISETPLLYATGIDLNSPRCWGAGGGPGHTRCPVAELDPVLCRPGETLSLPLPTGRTYHHRKAIHSLCSFVKETMVDSSCNLYLDYINKHEGLKILPLSSGAGSPASTSVCSCDCLPSLERCGD